MIPIRIKKWLCQTSSIYQEGKLVVPANMVILGTTMWAIVGTVFVLFIATTILELIKNPLATAWKILDIGLTFSAVVIGVVVIGYLILFKLPNLKIIQYLGKKLEISCDRITFPESVTKIFAEIEALPEEDMKLLTIGLRPMMRKYKLDEKL